MNNNKIFRKLKTYLLSVILLSLGIQRGFTQDSELLNENGLFNYELSFNMQYIFRQGFAPEAFLKFYHKDNEKITGAWRLGLQAGYGAIKSYDTVDDEYKLSSKTVSSRTESFDLSFLVGYEKDKYVGPIVFYYGLDARVGGRIDNETPDDPNDKKKMGISLIPFYGIKRFFLRRLSASFEMGWENSFTYLKASNTPSKTYFFSSNIRLPYKLTINYHF